MSLVIVFLTLIIGGTLVINVVIPEILHNLYTFIEKAPDRNSEWQKQKEDDDYFLDEEEDIQEENRDFGNEDTWKDPSQKDLDMTFHTKKGQRQKRRTGIRKLQKWKQKNRNHARFPA